MMLMLLMLFKIAGNDIVGIRYFILSCAQIFTLLFQSSNHSVLLGRSSCKEIANLSEDEDGKEDVAKAPEDGKRLPIILRL